MTEADYYALLGKKMAEIRKDKGIAQDKLALKCEIARSFVGDVERGKRNLSLNSMCKIAVGLGVSPSDLLELVDKEIALTYSITESTNQ
mgnify:CR=1 FL=1